jgi:hypothetical protein
VHGAVKNGAWVYEKELFHLQGDEVVVDNEMLCILHDILTNTSLEVYGRG